MTTGAGIPPELRRGVRDVLPDRAGYVVMLDPTDNLPCPHCHHVMAFGLLVQHIAPAAPAAIAATWSYRCFGCPTAESPA